MKKSPQRKWHLGWIIKNKLREGEGMFQSKDSMWKGPVVKGNVYHYRNWREGSWNTEWGSRGKEGKLKKWVGSTRIVQDLKCHHRNLSLHARNERKPLNSLKQEGEEEVWRWVCIFKRSRWLQWEQTRFEGSEGIGGMWGVQVHCICLWQRWLCPGQRGSLETDMWTGWRVGKLTRLGDGLDMGITYRE